MLSFMSSRLFDIQMKQQVLKTEMETVEDDLNLNYRGRRYRSESMDRYDWKRSDGTK